jgi:hypothetical protein
MHLVKPGTLKLRGLESGLSRDWESVAFILFYEIFGL